jgi:hypothetical protein
VARTERNVARCAAKGALLAAVCGFLHAAPPRAKMTCGTCHMREAATSPKTEMGIGLELPADQALLQAHPHLSFQAGGFSYQIDRKGEQSTYTVRDASGTLTLPIRYAFGVSNQTFVLEYEGKLYESLVSYYQNVGGLAITVGDERLRPRNLVDAMGRQTSRQEITACFDCHGTGGVKEGKLALDSLQPGVTCGHCHKGAEAHLAAMQAGQTAATPEKLGRMRAEDMSNFCGQCHRTWESVVQHGLFGPNNVRFQPYRLAESKCFLGNDPRIRCTACHDPHVQVVREASAYDHVCLGCHRQRNSPAAVAVREKPCPLGEKQCVTCHMPKADLPGGVSTFTDHYIRVVREGEGYPD